MTLKWRVDRDGEKAQGEAVEWIPNVEGIERNSDLGGYSIWQVEMENSVSWVGNDKSPEKKAGSTRI